MNTPTYHHHLFLAYQHWASHSLQQSECAIASNPLHQARSGVETQFTSLPSLKGLNCSKGRTWVRLASQQPKQSFCTCLNLGIWLGRIFPHSLLTRRLIQILEVLLLLPRVFSLQGYTQQVIFLHQVLLHISRDCFMQIATSINVLCKRI